MQNTICRSALYMPGSNKRALEKATTLAADAIVMDLEDSVAPDAKPSAREEIERAVETHDYGHRLKVLRVNDLTSSWIQEDLLLATRIKPDAVLLPKVQTDSDVLLMQEKMDSLGVAASTSLWVMLETPLAVINAASIAATSQRCARLSTFCIGNNDLAKEAGMPVTSDRTHLIPWLLDFVIAAKAYRLNILDGVFNNFSDLSGFEHECKEGKALGMTGKTLIHPSQIEMANAAYSPNEDDIRNAQAIVDAFAQAGNESKGVLQVDGAMVERLHLQMAENTLALAALIKG